MRNTVLKLCHLPVGKGCIVSELHNSGGMRRRLIDLGFSAGSEIFCVGKAPLGDPKAFWVKGTIIALRKEDSEKIKVEIL